jgi:septal ring factor EnvC (AmiA/AmiB activator)
MEWAIFSKFLVSYNVPTVSVLLGMWYTQTQANKKQAIKNTATDGEIRAVNKRVDEAEKDISETKQHIERINNNVDKIQETTWEINYKLKEKDGYQEEGGKEKKAVTG